MATHATLSALFSAIADAIRAKTGGTDTIVANDFPESISNISTGGSNKSTFTVEDVMGMGFSPTGTYEFELGMTWEDFVSSSYNTAGFAIYGTTVGSSEMGSGPQFVSNGIQYPAVDARQLIPYEGQYYWGG